jgi:hypothetical protein
MTIKELYEWAKENGAENYELLNYFYHGKGEYQTHWFDINHEEKEIYTNFEC